MNRIGVLIRKWNYGFNGKKHNPSRKNLNKQILTLHRKLKKKDNIYTEYSIEKDPDTSRYHVHLIIHYNYENNLNNRLSNFIGGTEWRIRTNTKGSFNECNGKYGFVHTDNLRDELKYREYINKYELSTTLV
ncbi:hypothetical protein SLH46_18570 [Draconibacterium sp. IB214405]|uniref:hypothetical protein n=1 Tax=Draconibacterium sp. IB214405 TaxID=3097352 RepID=UPI002A149600|nr:hypothetical protein [Draconibacterium sp. IB214405]MDX8341210.1 hypothetical protein [Draconibacterium sp. IB214405]